MLRLHRFENVKASAHIIGGRCVEMPGFDEARCAVGLCSIDPTIIDPLQVCDVYAQMNHLSVPIQAPATQLVKTAVQKPVCICLMPLLRY